MIKGQAAGEQFLTRTGSFSTHGSRTGVDLLGLGAGEEEELTPQQQREAIRQARIPIEIELANIKVALIPSLPYKVALALRNRRRELGLQLTDLNAQAAALNATHALRRKGDLGAFIIDTVRKRMTKPEWRALIIEAQARLDSGEII